MSVRRLKGFAPVKTLALAIFASLLMISAGFAESVKTIVATVNDDVISSHDIDQRLRLATMTSQGQIPEEMLARIRSQILRNLIDEKLRLQEIERMEVPAEDEEIQAEIEQLASQNGMTYDQFRQSLESNGISIRTIEDQLKADIGWAKLVRGRYGRSVSISDTDVDYAYEQALAASDQPSYLVSEIFLDIPAPDQEREVFQNAQQLIEQIRRGTPFPAMAQQFSQSISAASGGDLGWLTANDLEPEVAEALKRLSTGQVSRPIRTREGYTIVALRQVEIPGKGDPLQSTIKLRQLFFGLSSQPTQAELEKLVQTASNARRQLSGCGNLEQVASGYENAIAVDAETFRIADLPPALQQVVLNLASGQSAMPVPSNRGVHVFIVCSRKDQTVEIVTPSREDVENRLYGQQLSMYAKRYIRDLRADAIIEYRQF